MIRTLLAQGLVALIFLCNIEGLAQIRTFPEGLLTVPQLEATLPHLRQQIRDVAKAMVHVTVENSMGGIEGDASGFIVKDDQGTRLETAYHVVETLFSLSGKCDDSLGKIVVSSANRKKTEEIHCSAFVQETKISEDYATFRMQRNWKGINPTLPIHFDSGDEVLLFGFPALFQDGLVGSLGHAGFPEKESSRLLKTTAVALPGMSGGAAFRIGPKNRLQLVGQIRFQTGMLHVMARTVTLLWGNTEYVQKVCFDQKGYNDLYDAGIESGKNRKVGLLKAKGVVEKQIRCPHQRPSLNPNLFVQLSAYRNFLETYLDRPTDNLATTFQKFRATYQKLVQTDSPSQIKFSDFPIGSSELNFNQPSSSKDFQVALQEALKQLDRYEIKLDRIETLFSPHKRLNDWLKKIADLDLENNLSNINDYLLFGLGVIQLWYGR